MRTIMFMTAMLLASSLVASAQNASGGDGTSPQNPGSTGGATLDQNTDKPKQGKPTDATTGQGVTLHDESEALPSRRVRI